MNKFSLVHLQRLKDGRMSVFPNEIKKCSQSRTALRAGNHCQFCATVGNNQNLNFQPNNPKNWIPWCAFKSPALFLMASQRWSMIIQCIDVHPQRGSTVRIAIVQRKILDHLLDIMTHAELFPEVHKIDPTHSPFSLELSGPSLILEMDYSQIHLIYAHTKNCFIKKHLNGTKHLKNNPALFRILPARWSLPGINTVKTADEKCSFYMVGAEQYRALKMLSTIVWNQEWSLKTVPLSRTGRQDRNWFVKFQWSYQSMISKDNYTLTFI